AVCAVWPGEPPCGGGRRPRLRQGAPAEVQALVDAAQQSGALRPDVTSGDIGMLLVRMSRPLPGGIPAEIEQRLSQRHLNLLIDGLRATARQPAELGGPVLTLADLRQFPRPETQTSGAQATVPGQRPGGTASGGADRSP